MDSKVEGSVVITIVLSLAGAVWAVISYTLFTKWFFCGGEALRDKLVQCIVRKYKRGRKNDLPKDKMMVETAQNEREFQEEYNEANGGDHNAQCEKQEHINILSGSNHEISATPQEMNESQIHERDDETDEIEQQRESGEVDEEDDIEKSSAEEHRPLLGSHTLVIIFTVLHLIAKPIVVAVNIVYLLKGGNFIQWYFFIDILGNADTTTSQLQSDARCFSENITNFCIFFETGVIVTGPISVVIFWICFWRRHDRFRANCCRKFLEYLHFSDLEVAFLVAPFANIHLFFLGEVWYTVLIVRLVFYAITFSAAVIAGMRYVCALYCIYCCSCGCNNDVVEIRNYKHLFGSLSFQLFSITLKLMTASSAFSTYLKLGIQGSYNFRLMYLTFTVIRGVSSLFSLGFSAAMLRWSVLKREHQMGRSCQSRILGFFDKYQLHTHTAFLIDIVSYLGLLVLNAMIVNGEFVTGSSNVDSCRFFY